MSELTKEKVAGWISDLIPFIKCPIIIASEGMLKDAATNKVITDYNPIPGEVISYDGMLGNISNIKILSFNEELKTLVHLYEIVEKEY